MNSWLLFWEVLLIAAFSMFGILAIVVAIGGFFDIRALLTSVDAQHGAESKPAPTNLDETP